MKMIVFFFAGADFLSEGGEAGMIVFFFLVFFRGGGMGCLDIYDKRYVIGFNYLREREGRSRAFFLR